MTTTKRKVCVMCKSSLPRSRFYQNSHGVTSRCRPCHRAWAREYRAANPRPVKKAGARAFRHTPLTRVASELWWNVLRRSATRGLPPSDLTRDWVLAAVADFCARNHHSFAPRDPFRPSLDRIDRTMGYTTTNVRVVWLIENLARNSFTDEQVMDFCQRKAGLK